MRPVHSLCEILKMWCVTFSFTHLHSTGCMQINEFSAVHNLYKAWENNGRGQCFAICYLMFSFML